jgi:hypothetical protein
MICRADALDEIITTEPFDGPLPTDAADVIARWLLGIADRQAAGDADEDTADA